ncbi:MAG TPA: enoyl-CoA hydratase/isomerase family protein [Candidatus Acidoferrales bacterium]|nr:enoyl-CoA hydratase/isomerase family protein [Candidatus Acidoferrales bacterium]
MPSNSGTTLRASREGRALIIAFENPAGIPRLERAVLAQLLDELRSDSADSSTSGIVITGTDKAFAAGAEISELAALTPLAAREFSLLGQSVMACVERSPKPVIAAIRGYCFGGGLDLALACHVRIASPGAQFAHPGASLGILTGWGGTQRLPRTLLPGARSRALELFSTGRTIAASEALLLGLLSRILPAHELLSNATRMLEESTSIKPRQGKTRDRNRFLFQISVFVLLFIIN